MGLWIILIKLFFKNYELLIRGFRDVFGAQDFHNKCDGHNFTLAFIETTDGRKFGGFTEETWDESVLWKKAPKSLIFSLDNKEIYYLKKGKDSIYCYKYPNPFFLAFGGGHDFALYNECNKNYYNFDSSGNFYDTIGKKYVLALKASFCVKDYEVFKLNLI